MNKTASPLYSEDLIKIVAHVLKEERMKQNLSHEEIADKARIHRTAVGHIENGTRKPSLYVFIKLAHALNINSSDLIKIAEKKYGIFMESKDQ